MILRLLERGAADVPQDGDLQRAAGDEAEALVDGDRVGVVGDDVEHRDLAALEDGAATARISALARPRPR